MPKFPLLSALFAVFLAAPLLFAVTARADSLSCASVNGVTRCSGSGGLDCQSVDGRMVCAPGAQGSCETADGITTCRNGSVTQSFRTDPRKPQKPGQAAPMQPQQESDTDSEDPAGPFISVERDEDEHHIASERLRETLRRFGLDKH